MQDGPPVTNQTSCNHTKEAEADAGIWKTLKCNCGYGLCMFICICIYIYIYNNQYRFVRHCRGRALLVHIIFSVPCFLVSGVSLNWPFSLNSFSFNWFEFCLLPDFLLLHWRGHWKQSQLKLTINLVVTINLVAFVDFAFFW